jgi:hypothetical protein
MSNLQDGIALVIVLVCVVYAMRALLPRSVLSRLVGSTGNGKTAPNKSGSCGGCNNCGTGEKSTDDGCH